MASSSCSWTEDYQPCPHTTCYLSHATNGILARLFILLCQWDGDNSRNAFHYHLCQWGIVLPEDWFVSLYWDSGTGQNFHMCGLIYQLQYILSYFFDLPAHKGVTFSWVIQTPKHENWNRLYLSKCIQECYNQVPSSSYRSICLNYIWQIKDMWWNDKQNY